MEFIAQLPLNFLVNCVFLNNHCLSISEISGQVGDRHLPLLWLSFDFSIVAVANLNHLALEFQICCLELLQGVQIHLSLWWQILDLVL